MDEPGEAFETSDHRTLYLRPIRPADADALRRGFARLTPDQVRLRTFHRVAELTRETAERMTHIDPEATPAYVAVDASGEIRGEARMHVDPVTQSAEFGIAVDPAFARIGIGRRLVEKLLDEGRRRGVDEVWGDVLAENHAMLEFARAMGAERRTLFDEPGVVRVIFALKPAGASGQDQRA